MKFISQTINEAVEISPAYGRYGNAQFQGRKAIEELRENLKNLRRINVKRRTNLRHRCSFMPGDWQQSGRDTRPVESQGPIEDADGGDASAVRPVGQCLRIDGVDYRHGNSVLIFLDARQERLQPSC